jgi:hypothetical protein
VDQPGLLDQGDIEQLEASAFEIGDTVEDEI